MRWVVVVLLVSVAGCGRSDGPETFIVTGTVTYQGQPVQEGEIRFAPVEGTKGPASGSTIRDGVYTVTARGGVQGRLRSTSRA